MTGKQGLELCPNCQAPHGPEEAFCWICRRRFWDKPSPRPTSDPLAAAFGHAASRAADAPRRASNPLGAPPSSPPAGPLLLAASDSRWTQPVLIGSFVLVMLGLFADSQGGVGTVLMSMGVLSALFVTALMGFRPKGAKPTTLRGRIERALTVAASTIAVMILAALALALAVGMVCLLILKMVGVGG